MNDLKSLSHSLEDYLEAILIIETKQRVARVRDIAKYLQVQMPSVTGAVKNLKEKGLVEYKKNSFIYLSPKGKEIAENIYRRHEILVKFLEEVLFVTKDKAENQACRIEHVIDSETAKRMHNCTELLLKKFKEDKFLSKDDWKKELQK